jgi:hypothetical protein
MGANAAWFGKRAADSKIHLPPEFPALARWGIQGEF